MIYMYTVKEGPERTHPAVWIRTPLWESRLGREADIPVYK